MAEFWELPLDARNVFPNWFIQNTDPALNTDNRVTTGKPWIKSTNDTPPYGLCLGLFFRDSDGSWQPMLSSGPAGATGATGAAGAAGTNGTNGADGSVIRVGAGVPSDGLGVNGDVYISTTQPYNVYQRAAGVYGAALFSIQGPPGAQGGQGVPGFPGEDSEGAFGGGANTPSYNSRIVGIPFVLDDGGAVLATGVKGGFEIPFDGYIMYNSLGSLDGVTGSIVIDLWKDTYANFPPTVADTITASAKPTITTSTKSQDKTLTNWIRDVKAGDWIFVNIDSVTSFTKVLLSLVLLKNP